MKISRTVKRNLLLKIKQVKFFLGNSHHGNLHDRTCSFNIFFTPEWLPSSTYSKFKLKKIIVMKMMWYLIPSCSI